MRKVSLLLALVAFSATASFANSKEVKPSFKKISPEKELVKKSCTVNVKYGKNDITITNTCDCTQKEACDGAYKVATILL